MDNSHSSLMARDYKFFEAARKAALESDFSTKVGAIAVYGNRIIASAFSSQKTNPLQSKYNVYRQFQTNCADCLPKVHAEISLITKLRRIQNIDFKRVKVYVYRVCKIREKGIARPCRACLIALRDAGIRTVYYTTDFGYAQEWIDYKGA